jgi:RNA polymerase sigma factor (sigma-70 family)
MTRLVDICVPQALLERARAGEEPARCSLYLALAPATFALIRRLVGARAVAEDLFQDTMMIFYERLAQFRGEGPLGAWLRPIAVSRCLMHLRSPWRRLCLSLEAADFGLADEAAASIMPVTPAYRAEYLDLERALQTLSPTARAVLWMYEVEGYTHQEIAVAFGRSVSFSKSQLARAHLRLRAWFEPEENRPPCALI